MMREKTGVKNFLRALWSKPVFYQSFYKGLQNIKKDIYKCPFFKKILKIYFMKKNTLKYFKNNKTLQGL